MSSSSAKRWDFEELIRCLEDKNHITWICEVNANPTQNDILNALLAIHLPSVDLILAIGGGSVIDLAKGISAFYNTSNTPQSLESLTFGLEQKSYKNRKDFIDIIAVPTTAGTGSELTQWATIWDMHKNVKYSIDHEYLKPKLAIIVPELTLSLSKELSLTTGLDALSHAVEALEYLPRVLDNRLNLSLREFMCRASVLAGIAFSQTRTTACHSISYPLTMIYHIPHGIAVAMTLGEVASRNKNNFVNDDALYKLFDQFGGLQNWLDKVCIGITNLKLSSYQITPEDIDSIVSKAFTSGRMDNNPILFTEHDVKDILINIF
jgi:alcohol dehydrogenase class IV